MAMPALTGLALWGDLPEARDLVRFAYVFTGINSVPGAAITVLGRRQCLLARHFEHAAFQDILLAIGDPQAYSSPFWKNSPYFALYNVQPYCTPSLATLQCGRFNLDPNVADYMLHVSRVFQNGYFRAYADLCDDQRPRPADRGMEGVDRLYPTACEFLVRDFIASAKPFARVKSLSELPHNASSRM